MGIHLNSTLALGVGAVVADGARVDGDRGLVLDVDASGRPASRVVVDRHMIERQSGFKGLVSIDVRIDLDAGSRTVGAGDCIVLDQYIGQVYGASKVTLDAAP